MSRQKINRRYFGKSLAGWAFASAALHAAAQSPSATVPALKTGTVPSELASFGQGAAWQIQGSGTLRFFGFKAYDATLWTAPSPPSPPSPPSSSPPLSSPPAASNPFATKELFALEIVYNTGIKSEEIVNVSLVEMTRLRRVTEVQLKTWTAEMQRTFPSVVKGDRLIGLHVPKAGTRFFFNSRLIAEINDPAFSDAFFAIWLDPSTKRPDLRKQLLG